MERPVSRFLQAIPHSAHALRKGSWSLMRHLILRSTSRILVFACACTVTILATLAIAFTHPPKITAAAIIGAPTLANHVVHWTQTSFEQAPQFVRPCERSGRDNGCVGDRRKLRHPAPDAPAINFAEWQLASRDSPDGATADDSVWPGLSASWPLSVTPLSAMRCDASRKNQ